MPVVEATGVAARSNVPGLGKIIEKAMSDAVLQASADGVTDPAEVKARMMQAREQAKAAFYAAQAEHPAE